MTVLAIVPTFVRKQDELEVTVRTLETLQTQEPDLETLVIDDCSPDKESLTQLRDACERLGVRLYERDVNGGFSSAVNVGLREALERGLDAVLVNADIEFLMPFVKTFEETLDSQGRPAAVVGALLLYPSGLIQHCSPGDEKVLTGSDGYVSLAELDPSTHKLVAYSRRMNMIHRGGGCKPGGFSFGVTSRPYSGRMLRVEADGSNGSAAVTPNHKVSIHWAERAFGSWVVYLMRRGDDWRVGQTKLFQQVGKGPQAGSSVFGPGQRLRKQRADDLWIVKYCRDEHEAWAEEKIVSLEYGIPTLVFNFDDAEVRRGKHSPGLMRDRLDEFWRNYDSRSGSSRLLSEHGLDSRCPIVSRSFGRIWPMNRQARPTIFSANLAPGYMEIPVDVGGLRPGWSQFTVTEDRFEGSVYSLDVPSHQHYVNNNLIVHNSGVYIGLFNRGFDHKYRYAPAALPEAHQPCICPVTGALFYVRHSTLETVGLFDEQFGLAFEDVDYCLRTFESGLECVYNPAVRQIHHESMFRGQRSDQIDEWHQKSITFLHEKHGQTPLGRYVLPLA